ncbi:MAG: hypothetical protein ABJH82_00715 [Polaribacter sp.]|uniref:hypothetical protein n=1 Tax=Polaribacter sp. TaxID=1920175 RepID=UPI0032673EA4
MNFLFSGFFTQRMAEGGPLFMYTILICLLACLSLITYSFIKGDVDGKKQKLISHVSLFALIFGFLGFMIGMIQALDVISVDTSISSGILAKGLKIGLLSPTFGIITFLIARLGMIGLTLKKK